jgi:putative NADH-flavin reductase
MKIVVFGATGGTGGQVVEQAVAGGHEVVAYARLPEKITMSHPQLAVVAGDVLDVEAVGKAVTAGVSAVVSALGTRNRGPTTVYSDGVANILRAMNEHGVRRIVTISSGGVDPDGAGIPMAQRLVTKFVVKKIFANTFNDMLRMEDELRHSGLDWTALRAPMLNDGSLTKTYRMAVGRHVDKPTKISRADLAHCILTHLSDVATYQNVVEASY